MAVRQSRITKERPAADSGKLGRELLGLFTVFCGLLVILSLATFDSRDPWLNHVVSGVSRTHNKAGLFGAYLAGFLYDMIGFAAWVVPVFFCLAGARRILNLSEWAWWRWFGFMLLGLCLSLAGATRDLGISDFFAPSPLPPGSGNVSSHGGGIVGRVLYTGMAGWLGSTGTLMIWLFSLLLAVQMITGLSWLTLLRAAGLSLWTFAADLAKKAADSAAKSKIPPESVPAPAGAPAASRSAASARQFGGIEATASPRMESAGTLPFENGDRELARGDVNAGVERPELFRQQSETTVAAASRPDLPPDDALLPAMPDAAVFSDPHPPLPAGPFSLQALPEDEAGQKLSLSSSAGPLLLDPSFSGPRKRASVEEDDLPPWVRDFEEDKLGVADGLPLSEPFCMPLPSLRPEDNGKGAAFSAFPQPDEQSAFPPAAASLPGPTLTWDSPADPAPASDPAPDKESDFQPEATEETGPARYDNVGPPGEPCLKEPGRAGEAASGRPEAREGRIPGQAAEQGPEPESGHAGGIRIIEQPAVAQATAEPSGVFRAALALVKKPVRIPLPPLDLLEAVPAAVGGMPRSLLEAKGRSLMTCLNDFGIQGELVGITPGPVVTMFEVRPAPGVRVSRIANLSDDLALALKAVAVRIQAPVPGTDTVGIEIPNDVRETVCLKELLGSRLFQEAKSLLTLALGKDIAGEPAVADLASMPHLLVAGATGAGKSVGINSIILSLIYKARPEEVKLLLVDPKRVEMAIYADLPHLVHPVVTEMQLAKNALEWAVAEMERRYNAIARASVRNIADYNAKVAGFGDRPPPGLEDLEPMPYLVIVIDELADLMLVAAKEVETSIVRLAQLARAAGIHLILATQRPSVDVVTGLIKANFPCRIAFQVTSKHDSRTILDTVGAEHLLGKGDMLFKPGGGKFRRMHGAFVSDKNVNAVVDYWRSKQKPDYQIDFTDWGQESGSGVLGGEGGGGDIASDPVYNEAVEFVRQQGKASISLIQRKFRIGFNKAARFVEQMEQDGIIGPADGSRPRLVIR